MKYFLCGFAALLFCFALLLQASANTANTAKVDIKNYSQKLEEMQAQFVKWRQYFDFNSENNLGSMQNYILHDMSHNCRQAELEIHNVLDLLIIMGMPDESQKFRQDKYNEVMSKLEFISKDMLKRSKFSEMNEPLADKKDIVDYLRKMKTAFKDTAIYLQKLKTDLQDYAKTIPAK